MHGARNREKNPFFQIFHIFHHIFTYELNIFRMNLERSTSLMSILGRKIRLKTTKKVPKKVLVSQWGSSEVFWPQSGYFWVIFGLNPSKNYLAEIGKTRTFSPKMTENRSRKNLKVTKIPQTCFLRFKHIFWHVSNRIMGPEMPKNGLKPSKKYSVEIGKTQIFDLKKTQIRPKNTLKVTERFANTFLEARTHFFHMFSNEFLA